MRIVDEGVRCGVVLHEGYRNGVLWHRCGRPCVLAGFTGDERCGDERTYGGLSYVGTDAALLWLLGAGLVDPSFQGISVVSTAVRRCE